METAKEKQKRLIKNYLKPTLKNYGYKTSGQTWWKGKGDFFVIINLQNYSWNNQDNVDFRFNIGIALTSQLHDPEKKKATYNDLSINLTEMGHLPEDRIGHKFKNNVGYTIDTTTDLDDFIREFSYDFEKEILPRLDKLNSLQDCLDYYGNFPFWGENLKKLIEDQNVS